MNSRGQVGLHKGQLFHFSIFVKQCGTKGVHSRGCGCTAVSTVGGGDVQQCPQ